MRMKSSRQIAQKWSIVCRLVLLAILIMALAPAWPAAAQGALPDGRPAKDIQRQERKPEPAARPAGDVEAQGDIEAALAPSTQYGKVLPWVDGGYDGDAEYFGQSVAIQGDIMVVGAPYTNMVVNAPNSSGHSHTEQGAAYIYGRNVNGPSQWGLIKKLTVEDGEAYDYFGWSVAIDGDYIVVGADEAWNTGTEEYAGAAYVFERNTGGADNWGLLCKLEADDGDKEDLFGHAVAIQGTIIVVGAYGHENYTGAVYIFEYEGGNWVQTHELMADDATEDADFGHAVALDGSTLAIGARWADVAGVYAAGKAYIFERDGAGDWQQVKELVPTHLWEEGQYGEAVAIDGDTVVVGADEANVRGNEMQGEAYVYERNLGGANHWDLSLRLVAADGGYNDDFGGSVAISGSVIAIGAHEGTVGRVPKGVVYAFGRNVGGTNAWGQIGKEIAKDGQEDDRLGQSVAIDNLTIVAGARDASFEGDASGAAYIFGPFFLRVNVGGPKYIDQAGNNWEADRPWPSKVWSPFWGYIFGTLRAVNRPIANTDDDFLYQSERYWTSTARPGYQFMVPNGHYRVMFKYAETYWTAAAKRRFNVLIEKKVCLMNYDPFLAAGRARDTAAPDISCRVDVLDGVMDMDFIKLAGFGDPKADAIYIQQLWQR